MDMKYVPTTCPYCGTGCGFNLVVSDKKVLGVAPWHRNPVNEGKLCPKGNYAAEFINSPDRLTVPIIQKTIVITSDVMKRIRLISQSFMRS